MIPTYVDTYARHIRRKVKEYGTDEPYRVGALDEINTLLQGLERGTFTANWVMRFLTMVDETVERIGG